MNDRTGQKFDTLGQMRDEALPWWDFPRGPTALKTFVETGTAHGMTIGQCLQHTQISAEMLDSAETIVGANQELAVARNLVHHLGDQPGLGAEAGSRFTLGGTSILGFAMLASTTFRESLAVGIENAALSSLFSEPHFTEEDGFGRVDLDSTQTPRDIYAFLIERDLAALTSVLPLMMGEAARGFGIRIDVDLGSSRRARLGELFPNIEVVDADSSGLVIPRAALDLPLPSADPITAEICIPKCREILAIRRRRDSIGATVRAILLRDPGHMPSVKDVAAQLHLNVRTLHRRLALEGSTFHSIQTHIRQSLAVEMLTTTTLAIEEVAYRLGYSETAAFSRAYRRWTGLAPSQARRGTAHDRRSPN